MASNFRELHQSGCFVIPNPWDIGSARYLRHLGFKALATTSAGFAFSRGLPDDSAVVSRDLVLAHVAEIAGATELPINVDFQDGYGATPEAVAESVRLCVKAGAAGLSIEDSPGDGLYELPVALERLKAARAAIDATGSGVLLTARAECFLRGHPEPLKEAIRRLQAFAEAGADVLYAPGLTSLADIRQVVTSVDRPVNVLALPGGPVISELAAAGVRRVSVGAAFAFAALGTLVEAARELREQGTYGFGEHAAAGRAAVRAAFAG